MPAPPLATTRRTTLGALAGGVALGVVALGGCDLGDLGPGDDHPTPGTGGEGAVDVDQDLVDDVVAELLRMTALLSATRARFPRLRSRITPLVALHRAHLEALNAKGHAVAAPAVRAGSAAAALVEVRTRESRLQRRLAEGSVTAQSGALARLLASMSAAVAQQLAAQSTAAPTEAAS